MLVLLAALIVLVAAMLLHPKLLHVLPVPKEAMLATRRVLVAPAALLENTKITLGRRVV